MDRRAGRRERREESSRRAALPGAGRPDADDRLEKSHRWDANANVAKLVVQIFVLHLCVEMESERNLFYIFFFIFCSL